MKVFMKIFGLMFLAMLYGCEGDTTTANNAVPENYFNEHATLQGTIFDGVTGAKITDTSLKVTLVQGASYRNASVRTGTQTFAGDYSLSNIPISINEQTTYRLAVTATGYQDMESAISFDATSGSILDKNYNYLGNVQLYPLGSKANDIVVNVFYDGEPVSGVMVQLSRTNFNSIGRVSGDHPTPGTGFLFSNINSGYLGSLMVTTGLDGVATFPAANLVLGGNYSVSVLPVTHEGIPLAWTGGTSVTVGTSQFVQNVSLSELVPGNDNGLYVVSASNTDANKVVPSGVLTIVLSRAVTLVDEKDILASLGLGQKTAVLDASSVPNSTVTATLSTDGMTLTLTPNFTTAPVEFNGSNDATADDALTVSFSNVLLRLQDTTDSGATYSLFGTLVGPSGAAPSSTVLLTSNY